MTENLFWIIVGIVAVTTSLANIALYGLDKRRSRRGDYRISEKTFHLLGLLGGWPGAFIGGLLFHHKTSKLSYQVLFGLVAILNCVSVWLLWHLITALGGSH